MDITTVNGASAYQQSKVSNDVGTAVAAKVLDAQKQAGAGALQLLAAASKMAGGAMVAQATGKGGKFDVQG